MEILMLVCYLLAVLCLGGAAAVLLRIGVPAMLLRLLRSIERAVRRTLGRARRRRRQKRQTAEREQGRSGR